VAQGSFIVDDRGAVAMKATSSSRDAPEVHWGSVNTEAEKPSSKGRPVRLSGGSDNGFGSALEAGPTEASSSSRAAYDDHGRHHFAAEKLAVIEQDDPFKLIFVVLDVVQEYALPLIVGIFVALVMANVAPKTYQYYFSGCGTLGSGSADDGYGIDEYGDHRSLSAAAGEDCSKKRWVLFDCPVFGHHWTLHFLANDVVMSFHFALAMKEVTEALLPGGSLNPPSKAMNPIMVTIGCVAGPIIAYFGILKLFVEMGMFDDELDRGLDWSDLSRGWTSSSRGSSGASCSATGTPPSTFCCCWPSRATASASCSSRCSTRTRTLPCGLPTCPWCSGVWASRSRSGSGTSGRSS
jgi:hypothetical protein